MIRLFLKFFLIIVVIGLASRWTFESILAGRVFSDRQRVLSGLTEVHLDGLHLFAQELIDCEPSSRDELRRKIEAEIDTPLEFRPLTELSSSERAQLKKPRGFTYQYLNDIIDYLGVQYNETHYLRLGPISDQTGEMIEGNLAGWLRLLKSKIASGKGIDSELEEVASNARVPVEVFPSSTIPSNAWQRLNSGHDVAFYVVENEYYVASLLNDGNRILRLGPLPKIKSVAQNAIGQTLTLWFSLAGLCVVILIYNLSIKFRRIESAARAIAEGDLSARIDEEHAGETREIAMAFNTMATKTESLIRSKKELLQVISHELRTPLSRLRFAIELLENSSEESLRQQRLSTIHQSIDEMEVIVSEVLDYVRNQDSEPTKSLEWIDIQPALEPILRNFKQENPTLSFQWIVPKDETVLQVYANRLFFVRAIGNLVGNAQRYANSKLRIRICKSSDLVSEDLKKFPGKDPSVTYTCVEVEDDGPGIPQESRGKAIEPFVKLSLPLSASINEKQSSEVPQFYAGLGLGLAITNRILQQHGGMLQIVQGELGGCLVRTYWPNPH